MANPPVTIGPFTSVPAPGSPIVSPWPQQVSTVVTALPRGYVAHTFTNANQNLNTGQTLLGACTSTYNLDAAYGTRRLLLTGQVLYRRGSGDPSSDVWLTLIGTGGAGNIATGLTWCQVAGSAQITLFAYVTVAPGTGYTLSMNGWTSLGGAQAQDRFTSVQDLGKA